MISSPLSRAAPCLLVLLLLAASGPGSAQQGRREIMADTMARMMEAMGLFDSASDRRSDGGAPLDPMSMLGPLAATGWGPGFGMPWGGSFQDPSRAFAMGETMRQLYGHMPGRNSPAGVGRTAPWTTSRLEGIWEGRNGELLIVQGNRFRIYSPGMQRVDGLIQTKDDRLALYNPRDEHAQPFEFAESRGRLVMRDLTGQSYLYRRLRLDGGRSGAATKPPSMR